MKVTEAPSLQSLNTFAVPARAGLLIEVENEEDLLELPALDPRRDFLLGGGSNVLFADDVPGTVYLVRIRGIDVLEQDAESVLLEVGAGESWHHLVLTALDAGWHGLENLALIPGLAGAAPVQNIGAYGVELASVLESVTAWDWQQARWQVLNREDCRLAYRDSRFRSAEPDRYLIVSLRLRLARQFTPQLVHEGLAEALRSQGLTQPRAEDVCRTVIGLRRTKLPDPASEGNAGSFFKNPLLSPVEYEALLAGHPGLPAWEMAGGAVKIPAAWLIEHCGLKGECEGGAQVSRQHALVIVNRGDASGADVLRLARRVQARVLDRLGIALEPEPRIYLQPGERESPRLPTAR